ncbi:Unknown protein [Striga hermonthica]|uniref:Pectinesterase inhibitor domain-containing protein n=1 Tax=Striga hermonthica TaxID=68872 RepID=A0A9N7R6V1_STRHE|nr:Unknown protein [Striga hermonthica]
MAQTSTAVYFLLALLSSSAVSALKLNPFCANSDDQTLCSQLAGGAKTWAEAMTHTLESVRDKVKAGKCIAYGVESKLPQDFRPQTKESIAATCREAYDNVVDNIEQCIGFVKSDPYSSLDTYLSATTFTDCTDGLNEFKVTLPEVADYDKEVLKLSGILLAVAQKKQH